MLPPKHSSTPMVEEACAYVQGESLKAHAALLRKLLNSPITRGESDVRVVIPVCAMLLIPLSAIAQEGSTIQDKVNAIIDHCSERLTAKEFKTRVETISCVNDGMTGTYRSAYWPYMDLVYHFESVVLLAAAQADAGKISQQEYVANVGAAVLQFNADVDEKTQEKRAALAQHEERESQAEDERREANRRAVAGAILQSGGPFHPPPIQFYPMPTHQGTNCITSYIGNQAYTNCN